MDSIEEAGLKFPLVAKSIMAKSSAVSHEMFLVFNKDMLKKLKTPIVMQEFVNHGGVVFKVYVVGEHVKCMKRRSLQDKCEEENCVAVDEGLLLFSHISNLVVKNEGKEWSSEMDKLVEEAEMPPLEFVMELAKGLREVMGLRLFIFLGMFFMFKICVNGERDKYHFLILFLLHFCSIFLFWEERDIEFEQKYLFTPDFNRGGLRKTNRTYHRWVK